MSLRSRLRRPIGDVRTIAALLEGAEREAHGAGAGVPDAEHLLLSALDLPDGTARRAFIAAGADPDDLRGAIAAQHSDALATIGIAQPEHLAGTDVEMTTPSHRAFRATPACQQAFQHAGTLARSGTHPLCGAHVVAAVAAIEHGTVARVLQAMGVDRAALARAAQEALSG